MKRIIIIVALTAALLGGCVPVGQVIDATTTTVTNPVSQTNIYQVKNAYAAGLTAVVEYRNYCWARPYATLMADPFASRVCQNRRQVVRTSQAAKAKASAAIRVADDFVRNNPTGNAVSYINAAWNAVSQFQASVPTVK